MSEPRESVPLEQADAEMQRTADHDAEVCAFSNAVRALVRRYWFVGSIELIGALEIQKMRVFEAHHADTRGDDGDEWKQGAAP